MATTEYYGGYSKQLTRTIDTRAGITQRILAEPLLSVPSAEEVLGVGGPGDKAINGRVIKLDWRQCELAEILTFHICR